MKEFIDKLMEMLGEEHERCINRYGIVGGNVPAMEVKKCMEIVNELAEEYGKKNTYEITLEGCDDCTIFTMDLTIQEYEFLVSVSELANKTSFYGCMPRMYVSAEGE